VLAFALGSESLLASVRFSGSSQCALLSQEESGFVDLWTPLNSQASSLDC
jgi:hypothetical protein